MSKFAIPKRYDEKIAQEGVWFEMATETGEEYGSFLCEFVDWLHPRTKAKKEKFQRMLKQRGNAKIDEFELTALMLVEMCLKDWKVRGADGELIEYSKEVAMEYFSEVDTRYCLNLLADMAGDAKNFAADATVEEIEKN